MDIRVSERIKYLMDIEKISQYGLSKKIGVWESTISNWLNGKKEPSIESLWKLADYFDVSVDFLIGRDDDI